MYLYIYTHKTILLCVYNAMGTERHQKLMELHWPELKDSRVIPVNPKVRISGIPHLS